MKRDMNFFFLDSPRKRNAAEHRNRASPITEKTMLSVILRPEPRKKRVLCQSKNEVKTVVRKNKVKIFGVIRNSSTLGQLKSLSSLFKTFFWSLNVSILVLRFSWYLLLRSLFIAFFCSSMSINHPKSYSHHN